MVKPSFCPENRDHYTLFEQDGSVQVSQPPFGRRSLLLRTHLPVCCGVCGKHAHSLNKRNLIRPVQHFI